MPQLEFATYFSQIFWLFVSFGLLYFLLSKFCLPQLNGIIQQREARISMALQQIKKAKDEAYKLKAEYEAAILENLKLKEQMIADAKQEISLKLEKELALKEQEFSKMLKSEEIMLENFEAKSQDMIHKIAKESTEAILLNMLDMKISKEIISKSIDKVKNTEDYYV